MFDHLNIRVPGLARFQHVLEVFTVRNTFSDPAQVRNDLFFSPPGGPVRFVSFLQVKIRTVMRVGREIFLDSSIVPLQEPPGKKTFYRLDQPGVSRKDIRPGGDISEGRP